MNKQTKMKCSGVYRPRDKGPGFGFPVFNCDGLFFVQKISDNKVVDFLHCDVEQKSVRPLPEKNELIERSVGDSPLYAFESEDGRIELCERRELNSLLRNMTNELPPFVLYDVAEFLDDKQLINKAKALCKTILSNTCIPETGQMVVVRNRPGVVRDIEIYDSVSPEGTLHFVHIDYIDGWNHPEGDKIIWEREIGAESIGGPTLPKIDDFAVKIDSPERFQAFIDANRWDSLNRIEQLISTVKGSNTKLPLVSTWHSAVQVEDYQIYPVMKSLLMPRISLLLADDVGLGKTIEAGLIVTELFSRRRIRKVLIICPASLQHQWKDEMREKFHLDFSIINREETFKLQREFGIDVNPWTNFPRIITSMDYLSQPDILQNFKAPYEKQKSTEILPWDLLIVDEAHNFSPSMFGDETRRCSMLRTVRDYFEHRLFLTATPHNGYTVSFSGLLELLDPVRFQQKPVLDQQDQEQVHVTMVRRLKSELNKQGMLKRFTERKVKAIKIDRLHQQEVDLSEALKEYKKEGLSYLKKFGKKEQNLGSFIFTLLTKRLLSSNYAFARTWYQHISGLNLEFVDFDQANNSRNRAETSITDDEEKDRREEDASRQTGSWLNQLGKEFVSKAHAVSLCLHDMGWTKEFIDHASDMNTFPNIETLPPDSKWDMLQNWISEHLTDGDHFKHDERVILFTEYKHTLDYLSYRFKKNKIRDPEIRELFGGASTAYRETIKEEFNDQDSPLRILLATDAASEGLNMQASCRYVVHQEIPWNPMRLEQRNGRVDRHGQMRDVFVYHFSCDEDEDMKFLSRIAEKVNQVREDLGSVGQVIDNTILEHFTKGVVSSDELDIRIETVTRESEQDEDIKTSDSGDPQDYLNAMQELRATEMSLGLNSKSFACMLGQAIEMEQGRMDETDEKGVYRITRIPPSWEGLVKDTIRLRSQHQAMPKLIFDPSFFEEEKDNRIIYRPRKDYVLLRLGHPVMRRAVGVLKRKMWESEERRSLNRWTVHGSNLPSGIDCILVVYGTLQANNSLRESIHSEVLTFPFQVAGESLKILNPDLFEKIRAMQTHRLAETELKKWADRIRDLWLYHHDAIVDFIDSQKGKIISEFEVGLKEGLKTETDIRKQEFDNRLKELDKQKQPGAMKKLLQKTEKQKQRVAQYSLFADIQAEEEQKLKEFEWQLAHSHIEQMHDLVQAEKDRTIKLVLPRRFELANLDLHPLAVEYIVRSKREGDE